MLDTEALKIPGLHSKYYKIFLREKGEGARIKCQIEELEHVLTQYYSKSLTDEELDSYGLTYSDKRVMKAEIPRWISVYPDMVDLKVRHMGQLEKIEFVKSILQSIGQRSFIIKDAINFIKFKAGDY